MLFHGMVDTFASLVFPLFMDGDHYDLLWWFLVAVMALAAAAVVLAERRAGRSGPVGPGSDRTPTAAAAAVSTSGTGAR
jgi:hypothetical protein